MNLIEWDEADPAAREAFRASDELAMRECGTPLLFVEDYTFAWDASRGAYFPMPNCLPGMRPEAL